MSEHASKGIGGHSKHTNRLINETSPYLRQHADNPVDWYPWGAEAFEKARREDKPVLLSVGYSACHWCHRLREESFENPAIAQRRLLCVVVERVGAGLRVESDVRHTTVAGMTFVKPGTQKADQRQRAPDDICNMASKQLAAIW